MISVVAAPPCSPVIDLFGTLPDEDRNHHDQDGSNDKSKSFG
jgi:hypothetical protein